jgi:D-beta-D-heptose 7-phosphate kinase/D-beta-D-heptose 1-phosphate adenosyltransferase
VLVVGDLMLDEFIWGRVSRISPEAPVPVVEIEKRTFAAGGAANTAMNVASLGGRVTAAGFTGDDRAAEQLIELLSKASIAHGPIARRANRTTTLKTRIVAHSQQVVRIDQEERILPQARELKSLLAVAMSVAAEMESIVISDYGKGVVQADFVVPFVAFCRQRGIPTIVDPKGTDFAKYRGATVVKPNQAEAGRVLNRELRTDDDVDAAGRDLLSLLGGETTVLITRGPQGMSLFEPGRKPHRIPTYAHQVYDVTGAGDTVAGTLALALAARMPMPEACELASRAAAVVVQKVGTATLTLDELRPSKSARPMRRAA